MHAFYNIITSTNTVSVKVSKLKVAICHVRVKRGNPLNNMVSTQLQEEKVWHKCFKELGEKKFTAVEITKALRSMLIASCCLYDCAKDNVSLITERQKV